MHNLSFWVAFWLAFLTSSTSYGARDDPEEYGIVCESLQSRTVCVLGERYALKTETFEFRGAGDVQEHPMISLGQGGIGKFVGSARDLASNESVFVKCRPRDGGEGSVTGISGWREIEAERAVQNHPHVLVSIRRMQMREGGECAVYPLADGALTDRLQPSSHGYAAAAELEAALLQVLEGIAALHRAGYVHRDIKVARSPLRARFAAFHTHHRARSQRSGFRSATPAQEEARA